MANVKQVQAALAKKQADLDMMDDQLLGMPEMATDAPADMATSPEFDLLSEKRDELEGDIKHMQEGVELISQWESFKSGPWSEEIKGLLSEIDIEISDIAGGEVAAADELGGMAPDAGIAAPPMDMGAPAPDMAAPALDAAVPPPAAPAAPELPAAEPAVEAAPLEAPLASKDAAKSPTSKKNSYQSPVKKGVSASSDMTKEGSNMANPTTAKASVQEKLADVKSKREAIRREAQQRVAAAWTIAKTMLPSAPAEVQKSAAANLLQNSTRVLNAMLRQTAKNAHYSKLAETFKQVHKTELNEFLTEGEDLSSLKASVEKELKGDPKSAAVDKKADDRKDAGPQEGTYNDGRGCGGGKHTEPKPMDAGSSASSTEAAGRPEDTVNKSESDGAASKAAAKAAPKKADVAKKAEACKCEGECKCAAKEAAVVEKKADDMPPMDAAPIAEAPADALAEAPIEEAPMDAELPAEMPVDEGAEADSAGEVLSDEKKMIVEEKIEEAQEAIKALEQEILQEGEEELDLAQVFNEEDMEDKVSSLANEGDEHTAGNGEEFFAPTSAESLEASLDDSGMNVASMEDFFSLQGSDSDPLRALIAGEIRTAAEVAGMEVLPSSTGEAAKAMESNSTDADSRDNENDHDGDLFAEAIEDQTAEDGGFKRVKQDETNILQAPKSAAKPRAAAPAKDKKPVISKLKSVSASEQPKFDIASALLGDDEF